MGQATLEELAGLVEASACRRPFHLRVTSPKEVLLFEKEREVAKGHEAIIKYLTEELRHELGLVQDGLKRTEDETARLRGKESRINGLLWRFDPSREEGEQ